MYLKSNTIFAAPDFTIGVATSSFQIEGAADSRARSIWDTFCATPGKISDSSNGDIACDHYHLWEQDIELVASLGVDAYRFSISWPRVINEDGSVNQLGIDFYLRILDKLSDFNIKAYVTLYHWDLPQYLEDEGGWLERKTADAFAHYVDIVTRAFRGKVYSYATLNEPYCSAYLGYEVGLHAPGKVGKEYGKKAIHHLLLAHGKAMKVLKQNAPECVSGIVLNFTPFYPASNTQQDSHATALAHDHHNDWYIKPIMTGKYPDIIHDLPESHKPDIQPGDMALICQPIDFLGVNYYTRALVTHDEQNEPVLLPPKQGCELTAMGWEVYPDGLGDLLRQLHRDYDLPPIIVTENGLASDDTLCNGQVDDVQRIAYLNSHMESVASAARDGVNIVGYFVWSLLDNFEWAEGYSKRFGIVYVDYQTQKRTLKKSAIALKQFLKNR